MRILIIGGTGFIGRHLADQLLAARHELTIFSRKPDAVRPQVQHVAGDRRRISDHASALSACRPDVVVDMIPSSGVRAREVLDVFRGTVRRLVALSSGDVYRSCGVLHGSEPGPLEPLPLTESSPLRTKLQTYPPERVRMIQRIFEWLDEDYDKIPVEQAVLGDAEIAGTVLRLPMVYGPGDRLRRFLPVLNAASASRPAIELGESFAAWRGTKGYVDEVASAIALAVTNEQASGRVYNVGEADTLTELEWARQILDAAGWHGEIRVVPDDRAAAPLRAEGNFAQHWIADTSRIRSELGYRERITRDEAIRRTVAWEVAHVAATPQ